MLGKFIKNSLSEMSWDEAVENLLRGSEAPHSNDILGLNYHSLQDEKKKLASLYLALFVPVEYDLPRHG